MLKTYDVAELSVINEKGKIVNSTVDSFIGFDMSSGEQAAEFLCLLNGEEEYVQEYQKITYDERISRKYAGKVLEQGGFVQVGYDAEHFQDDIATQISTIASNRHIGETGYMIIVDNDWNIVSCGSKEYIGYNINPYDENGNREVVDEYTQYRVEFAGEDSYYMVATSEGYIIVAIYPVAEATFSRNLSIYLNTFMEIIVFAGIFVLTFFVVREEVVLKIDRVDDSLKSIETGNLDTVVNEKTTKEFESLSDGINSMVSKLKSLIKEANERIDAELKYAAEIQHSALPSLFPPFPDKVDEFDIFASMDPAKEVGGDFYDFYLVKKHLLVIVMADVSGKGIPASLFMMRAKTLMKTYAEGGLEVNDIMTNANYNLCDGNDAGMFVTAWIGVINLTTGEMRYANAGHNPPAIKRKDGTYELLHSKPGFVLGGMEGVVYKEMETTFEPGDEIFLYTDGVTEATNINKELFGEDRLIDSLNRHSNESSKDLCKSIKKDVDEFVGEAPQFDDITMLSVKLKKLHEHEHHKEN